jgi:hypothetical protein
MIGKRLVPFFVICLTLAPLRVFAEESATDRALKEFQKSAEQTLKQVQEKSREVLSEVERKAGDAKGWAAKKYETVKRAVEPAKPLGKTILLQFSIGNLDQTTSVSTAMSEFDVLSQWHEDVGTGRLQIEGMITPDQPDGAYLVTCEGKIENEIDKNMNSIEFSSSVILKPSEKKLVTEKGDLKLTLMLNVEPPPQK